MAVQTQVVRFQKETTGVASVTQDVNLNFTPKAIIVYSDGNNADNSVAAHFQVSYGFSDGTNHACNCTLSRDAQPATVCGTSQFDNSVFIRLNEAAATTILVRGTCTFATNKVTFTWVVNNTTATYIHLIAFGGADITAAKVDTVDVGRATVGTQDYTGLGFNPSAPNSVLFTMNTITRVSFINGTFSIGLLATGAATSSSAQWSTSIVNEHGADPTDTWCVQYNDACVSVLLNSSGALASLALFDSWITDGFRLNWTDAVTNSDEQFSYLVINGGTWDTGTLQSPTAPTNNVDTAVSVGANTLRGLLIQTTGTGTLTTIQTVATYSTGATDGTNQTTISAIGEDAQATTDSYRVNNATNIIRPLTTNGAAMDTATFDSFPTTAAFRLDWGDADATARYYGWVVVADSAAAAAEEEPLRSHSFGTLQAFDNNMGAAIFGAGSEVGG